MIAPAPVLYYKSVYYLLYYSHHVKMYVYVYVLVGLQMEILLSCRVSGHAAR